MCAEHEAALLPLPFNLFRQYTVPWFEPSAQITVAELEMSVGLLPPARLAFGQ